MSNRFLKACRNEAVDKTPVWFMRQAGRYMEEYRALRQKYPLLEICRIPELAAEVTFQPIRRFELDAAIIFADILLPLPGLGLDFEFAKGHGPVVHSPITRLSDVERLRTFDPNEELDNVLKAIQIVRSELSSDLALIGFAGGPFTIASYMVEGGSSRHFDKAKTFMYAEERAWHQLMEKVSRVTADYLRAQVKAGADAIQLFDSWVGCLGPDDYQRFVMPYSRFIFQQLESLNVPMIHFGTDTSTLLPLMKEAGGTVIGVDWRSRIGDVRRLLGPETPLQGNLDPIALLGPPELLLEKVDDILTQMRGQPGHIFNLGHGILPKTPVESIDLVVNRIAEFHGLN